MPKLVIRYVVPEGYVQELANRLVLVGGRGGMTRTGKLIGIHRDTLLRGLRRREFGQQVGVRLIQSLKPSTPHIENMLVLTFG